MKVAKAKPKERAVHVLSSYIAHHGVIEGCVMPIYKMAQVRGVEVIEHDLPKDVNGLYNPAGLNKSDVNQIYCNINDSDMVRRFAVAHELGHHELHRFSRPHIDNKIHSFLIRHNNRSVKDDNGNTINVVAKEVEANRFAIELIIPTFILEKEVNAITDDMYTNDDFDMVIHLSKKFDVSVTLMSLKLGDMGFLF